MMTDTHLVTVVKDVFGARRIDQPDVTDPLMQPVEWQGQLYYTGQYFHQQHLMHVAEQGGKVTHKRYDNFHRWLRRKPVYHLLLQQGDILVLPWNEALTSKLRSVFQAVGYRLLTLLNATAQAELTHHLNDEPSKTLAYAQNKLVAEVLTLPALQQIKQTTEVIKALRDLIAEAGFGLIPQHRLITYVAREVKQLRLGVEIDDYVNEALAQLPVPATEVYLPPSELEGYVGVPPHGLPGAEMNRLLERYGYQVRRHLKTTNGTAKHCWEPTAMTQGHAPAWVQRHGFTNGNYDGYHLRWLTRVGEWVAERSRAEQHGTQRLWWQGAEEQGVLYDKEEAHAR
jgi:hypothetical protein